MDDMIRESLSCAIDSECKQDEIDMMEFAKGERLYRVVRHDDRDGYYTIYQARYEDGTEIFVNTLFSSPPMKAEVTMWTLACLVDPLGIVQLED